MPACPSSAFYGWPCVFGTNNRMEQEESFVSKTHSSYSVLALCVRHLNGFVCVVLEVFKCGGPYSCPAPIAMPSNIVQGEGLTWLNRGWRGCLHQMSYLCQSWPICSGPVPSLVVPLVTNRRKLFHLASSCSAERLGLHGRKGVAFPPRPRTILSF